MSDKGKKSWPEPREGILVPPQEPGYLWAWLDLQGDDVQRVAYCKEEAEALEAVVEQSRQGWTPAYLEAKLEALREGRKGRS